MTLAIVLGALLCVALLIAGFFGGVVFGTRATVTWLVQGGFICPSSDEMTVEEFMDEFDGPKN